MAEIEEIRLLEEIAANAWPPTIVQVIDGWRLRFNWGVTHRANSVWANQLSSMLPTDRLLAMVEEFYAHRHATPEFQISPASQPPELDDLLTQRGYQLLTPTAMQTTSTTTVLSATHLDGNVTMTSTPAITDRWSETYAVAEAIASKDAVIRRGITQRIGPPARFVLAEIDGEAASTGFGVMERGWVGIYSMTTRSEYRGQGAATAILHDLASWADVHGAGRMYLQVTEDNEAAIRLYDRAGFRTWYRYHYRRRY